MPDNYAIFWDVFGYVGMAFVLISFLMPKIIMLRVFNLVGSSLCFTYGLVTKTYPTAALNGALIAINGFLLIRWLILRNKEKKAALDAAKTEEAVAEPPSESGDSPAE